MTRTPKLIAASLAVAIGLAAPALAQNKNWDIDESGDVSIDEYRVGLTDSKIYARWDLDGDGMINEDEFAQGNFDRHDRDESGGLDDNERKILEDEVTWQMRAKR